MAGGGGSAGVASAADLVDGLGHDLGTFGPRDLGGAVGGVVVADDEFPGEAVGGEGGVGGGFYGLKRGAQELLFVESRNDDRNGGRLIHRRRVCRQRTVREQDLPVFSAA